jgi:hypothetical protein
VKHLTPLFETGVPGFRPIRCRVCGRTFAKWHGTSNHGFAHQRMGQATSALERGGQQWRSVFFVAQRRLK